MAAGAKPLAADVRRLGERRVGVALARFEHQRTVIDQLVADEQLGKRIRASKLERIPYVLVVGDDDVANSQC